MVTITINEKTKAGKALLATAILLSEQNKGITFIDELEDLDLLVKIKKNRKGDLLNSLEQDNFISSLKQVAK